MSLTICPSNTTASSEQAEKAIEHVNQERKKAHVLCNLIVDVIAIFHWEEASHPTSLSLREETIHRSESQMLIQNHLNSLSTTMSYVGYEYC